MTLARFTATTLSGILVELDAVRPAQLADELHKMFAGAGHYFQGEVAILDFSGVTDWPAQVDWAGVTALLRRLGLQPIGVRGVPDAFHPALARYHLAVLDQMPSGSLPLEPRHPPAPTPHSAAQEAAPSPSSPCSAAATQIVDRPVRSGQRIYHPEGDVVLLQGVNPGGEVIAGGNIFCWGPLAGRAIAGAHGLTEARILAARFTPELVAIAGIYKTFDEGVPAAWAGKAVQVRLQADGSSAEMRLQFTLIEL